jgi:cupin 2 domain-containing protein
MAEARIGNLFAKIEAALEEEAITPLLVRPGLVIERIVSTGQASPPGFWYDQATDEWVIVIKGAAKLEFDDGEEHALGPGDWTVIPAHRRHRVAWTHPALPTVWLAVHLDADPAPASGGGGEP